MQSPFEGKQPLGVVYNTSMTRPDAVFALAMLYGFQGRRESRIGSVSVNGAGLGAAVFCDIMQRFYTPGPERNANQVLMPGLAAEGLLPADSPMIKAAVDGNYARSIKRVSDTSLPEAVIRNGVIFNAEAVMILSARATYLAKSLDLEGVKDLYKQRVKMLVVVDAGDPQDAPAMRKVLAEFPAPIFYCGKEVGDALPFPGASVAKEFAWAPAHPVVDAYHAFRQGEYDFPSYDMAAALYGVHPDQSFFKLSNFGGIAVDDEGRMKFVAGGKVRALIPDSAQKDNILHTCVAMASSKPVLPQQRFKPPAAEAAKPAVKTP